MFDFCHQVNMGTLAAFMCRHLQDKHTSPLGSHTLNAEPNQVRSIEYNKIK